MEHGGVDQAQLINAVTATFSRRKTQLPTQLPPGLRQEFALTRKTQWQQFIKRNRLNAPELEKVLEILAGQCWPLMQQAAKLNRQQERERFGL